MQKYPTSSSAFLIENGRTLSLNYTRMNADQADLRGFLARFYPAESAQSVKSVFNSKSANILPK
jgi:hypothetical protein